MRVKITDAVVSIRDVSYDEMGIKEYTRFVTKDQMWDDIWMYEVVDKKKFFVAVFKYGITFVHDDES